MTTWPGLPGAGDVHRAVTLLEQTVSVADTTGDIESAVEARSGLARAQLQWVIRRRCSPRWPRGGGLSNPTEEPTMRLLEGLALLELHRADEGVSAFSDALTPADVLLTLPRCKPVPLPERTRHGHRRPETGHEGG